MDPLISLLIGIGIIAISIYLFLPENGLLAIQRNARKNKQRVLVEDALKCFFDNEYKGQKTSVQALAGALNITVDQATELIPKLEKLGLINALDKNDILLTDDGRSYALKVIRIHRIWERYLADETSVEEEDWHLNADRKEHQMTLQDADTLASKIGHPVIDPHGDPTPPSSGEIPDYIGTALNELQPGQMARIIHIEDEPKTIYLQLLAMGMYPGMELRVIESNQEKITFEFNGEELILAPMFAANVTVMEKSSKSIKSINLTNTLSQLKKGEKAKVAGISPACRKQQKRRLMDLGIVPGTEIEVALESAGRNPRAYKILNTLIALRNNHAALVYIEPIKTANYV